MDMDIRIPIGLLFVVLGAILAITGLFIRNNADLLTGIFMLLFGLPMLIIPLRGKQKKV